MKWAALGFGIVFNALANILMKAAARHGAGPAGGWSGILSAVLNIYLLAGIASFVLALGAYTFALTRFELSVAYPIMTSLGLVLVALASFLLFREPFTGWKTVGTLLILAGVLCVASGK
ncbi:MAG: EamA family transporter [Alicyclobacillaceae bacterium]|nr:EamA family transporter [Alicyclobacillaceae bacterium]